MNGACIRMLLARIPGMNFIGALLGAMLGAGILGVTVEFLTYRRQRNVPRVIVTASALGVSVVLSNAARVLMESETYPVPKLFETRYFEASSAVINSISRPLPPSTQTIWCITGRDIG